MTKFFVTTPIYYVNDIPHIGHAYTTLAADVLARWHRLIGDEVFFLTGTDEHGTKIAQAAAAHNKEPQQYCDEISAQFKDAWKALDITNDSFIRTTAPEHARAVQAFLKLLWEKGLIFKARYQGKYCVQCERFYTDEELMDGLCPDHRITPEVQSEDNYFFRLSHLRDDLLKAITDPEHPSHFEIFPLERRNEIIGKLKQNINDISMSRATLAWGIPLPWDRSQTTYVWVDALTNYITGAGFPDDSGRFEEWWPADLHLMAKDILWFHAVVWPAMLMAAGMKMPKKVFAHGFFTVNGQKMSKSLGNVVRHPELIKDFGIDGTRFLLLSAFPFGADGDFTVGLMKTAYNAALANDLGNLVSRALTMVEKYCGAAVPAALPGASGELLSAVVDDLKPYGGQLDRLEFHLALATLLRAVDRTNGFIEAKAPWKLAKTSLPECHEVLRQALLAMKVIALHLAPVMPQTAQSIWTQLGHDDDLRHHGDDISDLAAVSIPAGQKIRKAAPLFPRKE